jgi:glutamine synthetase type III
MRELEQVYVFRHPCKHIHNEVAPNQFELAPIFEETNPNGRSQFIVNGCDASS